MIKWLSKLFSIAGNSAFSGKSSKELLRLVADINALEPETKSLADDQLMVESNKLRDLVVGGESLDKVLPYAFALVRETAKRKLGQRHFDVQLMGGIVLHQGKIAEMRTGEGKTLAATSPVYLNALTGKGVHVVTVNEYLAKRDAVWMGQIYHALGLKVACLVHEGAKLYDPDFTGEKIKSQNLENKVGHEHRESELLDKERDTTGNFLVQEEYLRPISRREAYQADITYGTNHEFGFDYLRDNLAYSPQDQVQREYNFAVIDEVDSILIDEARTPLIISAPDMASSQYYKTFARVVRGLDKDEDYIVDEKMRTVEITEPGIDKVEKVLNIKNLYGSDNLRLTHYLVEALKAHALFKKDKDYVLKGGEIVIVDQFTGRLMLGRRYSGGLHQAIEAKEGLSVQNESRTYASISIQNYFRMYQKISGMTGTAQTSAEEFDKVYGLKVKTILTNQPMVRKDLPDLIYKTREGKYAAIIRDIKERTANGQPVLIGTVSIEKNEELADRLRRAGVRYEMLNAKNHEREGGIIAQAGKLNTITVATNMAGRGVDIILGGNPPDVLSSQKVKDAGGLHVVGTERHDSRRIDNQLRGRAGRQGDPGSSQFFLSLEDDLLRIFGGGRIQRFMEAFKMPEDTPIQAGMLNRAISQAQGKVEGFNFDARKHLLEYDDVLNKQRSAIYKKRQEILTSGKCQVPDVKQLASGVQHQVLSDDYDSGKNEEIRSDREQSLTREISLPLGAVPRVLQMLDLLWMNHLENMEALGESVRLRAYGQHDPLVEYRREGHMLFQQLLTDFEKWMAENSDKLTVASSNDSKIVNVAGEMQGVSPNIPQATSNSSFVVGKVGRNDPCSCGSGKKYKKCHGK
ncbi:MAG: preprotein translocase subunit SecA [bacterium]|nr:preprotein translocase subunit SecA [bacterium]